jgi:hypothetical protein
MHCNKTELAVENKTKLYKDFLRQKLYRPSLNFLNLCRGDGKIVELDHSLWLAPKGIFL